jgi:hypothetical protein
MQQEVVLGNSLVMLIDNDNDKTNSNSFHSSERSSARTRSSFIKWQTKIEAIIQIKYSGPIYAIHSMFLIAYRPILLVNCQEYFPCSDRNLSLAKPLKLIQSIF